MRETLPRVNWRKKKSILFATDYQCKPIDVGLLSIRLFLTMLMLFAFSASSTFAQITTGFELDGNATSVVPNPPDDWDKIYNNTSSAQVKTGIVSDLDNIFQGGGSKDDIDIPSWGWTTGSVPDKDDILHGGVALYNNCKLYFFADRFAINGSSDIGFWLFKNNISINPNGTFSGIHTVGDLLILSAFTNGGGTSIINAYKWVGTGGNTNGTLQSVAVNGTTSFATTNSAVISSPWPYQGKGIANANEYGKGAFFEGGIDLCSIPGLDACFTSFLVETRSSPSVDAVLKDFLSGSFASRPQISLAGASRCSDGPSVTLTANVTGGILPYNYSWSPGGATTPSITVTPTSTTTYTFSVTGSNGCLNTSTVVVNVNPSPNVNAGPNDTINCTSPTLVLSGSSTTQGATFSWVASNGGNIVSGGSTATPTINSGGTYILTVSANGCTASDTVQILSDFTPPNANAGRDTVLTCAVTQITLSGTSTTPGVTFSWVATNGGAILSGAGTANPTVQIPGTYVLSVRNPINGCIGKDSLNVSQSVTTPNVNAGPDKVLTCTTTSISLSGSSSTPNTTYSWSTNDGNILSGGTTLTPTVNATGSYYLTVTNTVNGCVAMDMTVVTLNNTPPNVSAGIDKVLTCTTTQINLSGSSTTPNATFSWVASNGGNIVSGGILTTPLVNAAGTYILTVTDPVNGCAASDTVEVTLNNTTPNVNAGIDKVLTCTTTSIALSGSSSTNGATFSWAASNGGNIVSGGTTATPTVDAAGTYVLTVTNPVNGCTAKDTAIVTLNSNAPNVNAGVDKVLTCTTTSIALSGSSSTNGATFSWAASNGGNIVSGETTATPTVNAAGTYVLTVTNPVNGCTAKDTAIVTLDNNAPNVNAGIDKVLTCTTTSIALSGSSSTNGATFSWVASNGGNVVSGGTTATPTVDAAGTYVLTVTNPVNGCTAKDTAIVTLNNTAPNVNAGIDKVLTCTTTSIALSGSSSTNGATFSWAASNGGNIVSGGTTASPTVDAAGTYVLTVTNPVNGCTAADTANVTLNNTAPNVNAGIDKVLTCTTTSIALSGSSSTSGATFSWTASNGGNIVSGGTTATPTVDAAGTYVLTVTNQVNGCTATDTAMVTLDNTAPNVNAGSDKVLTCATTQIALSGSSTTVGATFSWAASNGGNIVSGELTATPTVNSAGTYVLTVTNPVTGCVAMDTALVTLDNTVPNVDAGTPGVLTCTITQVTLTGSSSNVGASFSWDDQDGGNIVSGGNTATPLVDAAGTYVLTVTDSITGCTATDVVVVTLNNVAPNVSAGIDKTITCNTSQITLSGSSTTIGATFSWAASNGGNIVSGSTTATPTVDVAGTYVLTVTNPSNGCTATDSALVTVDFSTPGADAGADKELTCTTTQVTLNGSSSLTGAVFSWAAYNGGNIVSGATSATAIVDAAGTYVLTVTNPVNGCMAVDTVIVTTNNLVPNVSAGNDANLTCIVTQVTLNGSSTTPGATFSWDDTNGGNIVSGATTATPLVNAAGTYILTVTNPANGCTANDTAIVTIDNTPPDVDLGNDTTLVDCAGTIILDAGNAGSVYIWSTGATTQTITVSQTGWYSVLVATSGGCIATDSIYVTIANPPIDLGPDTTVCGCLLLNAYMPGASYVWCSGQNYSQINVCVTGTYCVTVTNGTCISSDTIHVTVNPAVVVNLGNDTMVTASSLTLDAGNPGMSYAWSTGDTTQTISVTASGSYYVDVTDTTGCSSSDTINVMFSNGVKENIAAGFAVNVYPNPTVDKNFTINFEVPERSSVEIRIMNELGSKVYIESLENFSGLYNKQLSLPNLATGLYLAEIKIGDNRKIVKISLK